MLARRAAAYLLDVAICFLAFAVLQLGVFLPLRGAFGIDDAWFHSGWNTQLYTLLTISLPVWAYFTFTQSSRAQATFGKRATGIRLESINGGAVSKPQAFLRSLIVLLPWELSHIANNFPLPLWYDPQPGFRPAFILAALAGAALLISTLLHSQQRGVHDLAAGTRVTRRNR